METETDSIVATPDSVMAQPVSVVVATPDTLVATSALEEFRPDLVDGYFHDNPLLHTELPHRTWGQTATPLPYSLQTDDIVTGGLLLSFAILVFCLNKTRKQILQQTRDFFFTPRESKTAQPVETTIENYTRLTTILLLSIMGSLAMFAYAQFRFAIPVELTTSRLLIALYVASFLVMFATRRFLSSTVNWIFFPKSQQKLWNSTCSYLYLVEVLLFFPLLITFVFFQLPFEKTILTFLIILLIVKFLLTFKAYNIFFSKSYGVFHLFAYLCALEIMPLLALWKLLAIVTENLIVKY